MATVLITQTGSNIGCCKSNRKFYIHAASGAAQLHCVSSTLSAIVELGLTSRLNNYPANTNLDLVSTRLGVI